jgi:DNA-binding transcriptional LysR family regulator
MNVTIRQLQAFVFVVRFGSFTKAAQEMYLTQSAVSLLVRELETILNARLIDRTTRNIQVTEVGKEFFAGAERILGDLEHVVTNVNQLVAKQRGRVVVTAPLILSSTFLPGIIAAFKKRYPGIELVLKDSLPDQVLPQVITAAADIGIGTFHRQEHGLHTQLLYKESLGVALPKAHPLSKAARLTWRDLKGMPILTLPRGSIFRELTEQGFRAAGLEVEPTFEATYVGTLIGLVRADLGIAIVPGSATALVDTASISWKQLEAPIVEREVLLVHRGTASISPATEAFADFLTQRASSLLRYQVRAQNSQSR